MFLSIHIIGALSYFSVGSRFLIFFVDIPFFSGFKTSVFVFLNSVGIQIGGVIVPVNGRPVAILFAVVIIQHSDRIIRIIKVHGRIGYGTNGNNHPAGKTNHHVHHRKHDGLIDSFS